MANLIRRVQDSLTSMVNNLGIVGKDKAASTAYLEPPLWTDADLTNMYRGAWLPKKIVNIPAFDATRKWRNWQADEKQITLIEAEERRLNLKKKLLEVMVKGRLYGGSALYISTGESDVQKPFDPKKIQKNGLRFINVMPKRLLNPGPLIDDPESEWFNEPEYYELAKRPGVRIHPSRLLVFKGESLPDAELVFNSGNYGWGDSVLTSTISAIKQVDATAANIASLVFEAKIDVVKIPDLMNQLSDPDAEALLLKRFTLANVAKGNNGILILDGEEDYQSKPMQFSTLPDVLQSFMTLVSGAADIPATRLMGQSPAGMNATGESDLRNYYDRVQSMQTLELDPMMEKLNEAVLYSTFGGSRGDAAIHHVWASLWQSTDKERAEIGKMCADTISTLHNTGLFPPEALANAGANMLTENSVMPGLDQEIEDAGGLPDYEAELDAERKALAAANANSPTRRAVGDAAPKTLYIRRDVLNAGAIRAWAKAQGFETVQDDLHVTVMHTRTPLDWIKVGNADEWHSEEGGGMTIKEGGPRLMERFGEAVVLQFASSRLTWRHEDIKRMGAEVDHPEYQPHITISWGSKMDAQELAKVEPYKGEILLGPEIFEEVDENWRAKVTEV